MPQRLLCLLLLVTALRAADTPISPVPSPADFRVATIQVRIAPDHRDWTYRLGEPAKFRIMVTADNTPVDQATVTYSVGPEMMPVATQTALVPLDGLVVDGGTLHTGGFIRCKASVEFAGRTYQGVGTAAFAPETIRPVQTDPADFDAFWQKGKDELAQIPVEAKVTLLPDACTDTVNVYHVGIRTVGRSWAAAGRVYGILTEPKAPGRYPAVLMVPGAGVRPYPGNTDLAARGVIVLEIGIHGLPVNLAKEVYDQLHAGALNGYQTFNLDDRDTYYYRRVYLNCIRANDFLVARPMWNGRDLLVTGASQGGLLSIVTAALDPRVTGLAAIHPALCDVAGPLHGRAGGWPHPFKPADDGTPSALATPAKIATLTYYDAVNFARRLKVPGFYIWGYNDEVCPPTSTFAAYNIITAPKTLAVQPEQAHTYPAEQGEAVNRWLLRTLKLN
ncbi:Acetyl esterase Axe7A precursor [Lacunisphaera limnophila]|uniref:Acetyl esterase Axe7A n=1 Tax=Lacunisphaera limnophila TaxID=1838286 RepID=A0A1D8ARN3_9BACT|nr:acetylxylan esterase [Lacunisphaera limnophila]AOS43553.1 Acetyl esterase Axe7A precursor [Lacunisphaera limnophila]